MAPKNGRRSHQARELLAHVLLAHVPVKEYNFWPKVVYVSQMLRRMISAQVRCCCGDGRGGGLPVVFWLSFLLL